jgi:OOP family OmpA-OmpF porin
MTEMKKHLGVFMATALLAGCAGFTGQRYVDDLNAADVSGKSFGAALAREYRDLANFEWTDMMDYRDGQHYAKKGLAAAGGDDVLPDELAVRDLPEFSVADITDARTRLMHVRGAAASRADLVAKAQAKFDCWMEQQEENHQPDHIAECRKEFEAVIERLGPGKYMVFFKTGSAELSGAAMSVIRQAAKDAKGVKVKGFTVKGHTDTVGNAAANKKLSDARAKAVKGALAAQGFSGKNIVMEGEGETMLLVPTPDSTNEGKNRRVEFMYR